jgi:hypothetical protein
MLFSLRGAKVKHEKQHFPYTRKLLCFSKIFDFPELAVSLWWKEADKA